MPDSNGRVKGIAVSRVPWHEDSTPMPPNRIPDPASYLAALIDGEGSVQWLKTMRVIEIGNTDYAILAAAQDCCNRLGIEGRIGQEYQARGNRKPYKKLLITGRENFAKVLDLVPIQAPKKLATLRRIVDGYCNPTYMRRQDIPIECLRVLREQGKSQREIALDFGVAQTTVGRWLEKADIA